MIKVQALESVEIEVEQFDEGRPRLVANRSTGSPPRETKGTAGIVAKRSRPQDIAVLFKSIVKEFSTRRDFNIREIVANVQRASAECTSQSHYERVKEPQTEIVRSKDMAWVPGSDDMPDDINSSPRSLVVSYHIKQEYPED